MQNYNNLALYLKRRYGVTVVKNAKLRKGAATGISPPYQ